MICDEIERHDVSCRHVAAYVLQQPSCDATVAAFLFHIQCADIRPEVPALVEVVVYYSCATYDFIVRHDQVSLRDVSPACNAFVDAGEVFCHRYAPLAAKPFCSPAPQSGTFVQVDDAIFVRSHCIHVLVSVRRKVRLFMQTHVKWVHISVICVYGRRRCAVSLYRQRTS